MSSNDKLWCIKLARKNVKAARDNRDRLFQQYSSQKKFANAYGYLWYEQCNKVKEQCDRAEYDYMVAQKKLDCLNEVATLRRKSY